MSKNKMFNVELNNGKEVTVQLDKSTQTYIVQGGHSYENIKDIKNCIFLNENSPEPRSWVKSKKNKQ